MARRAIVALQSTIKSIRRRFHRITRMNFLNAKVAAGSDAGVRVLLDAALRGETDSALPFARSQ
jgi:hypothetical protein